MYRYCQVCGSPIFTAQSHGTEANGQYSRDYCSDCYRGGQFSTNFTSDGSPAAYAAQAYARTY
jgi:hypothetical protein